MSTIKEIRELAESDFYTFARLVNPNRLYGDIHRKVMDWLSEDNDMNKLVLLPRGHMKSHIMAAWCAWWITKHPDTTILYISATAELAEKQLYDIKNMIDSDKYKMYWPEMLDPDEGKREKWAATKIAVDHPKRKQEGVRDWTVATAGLTTNTTGWHADVIVPDDVVVPDNAYTEDGRRKTAAAMSQLSSIKNPGGLVRACGTRYHPRDQYGIWKEQVEDVYDEDFELVDSTPIWDIFEKQVEVDNVFLWPRELRDDGRAYGFNLKVLSRIKAEYTDTTQFFAQYYNDPNDPSERTITEDMFQYYDPRNLTFNGYNWYLKDKRLNLVAGIDFAYSLTKKADFSAIVVIGIDSSGDIYVLDIDRFKTNKIKEYIEHIVRMVDKGGFRKLIAEVTAGQSVIVRSIKDHISEHGMQLSIQEHRPSRHDGSKEERMAAVLEPKYSDMKVWHCKGGYTGVLE
jgi:phage terminase large subunit-like protein